MALTKVTSGVRTLAANEVATSNIADDAVTADKLADNSVGLAAMAHGTDGNLLTYDASGAPAYVATGSANEVLTSNGAGSAPTFQAVPAQVKVAIIQDQKADGTGGGARVAGAWTKRSLNTEVSDAHGIVSLSSDQITLAAGTYHINARQMVSLQSAGGFRGRLYNITDGTLIALSESLTGGGVNNVVMNHECTIDTIVTLTGTKAIELQYYSEDAQTSTYGLGQHDRVTVGVEIFSTVVVTQLP